VSLSSPAYRNESLEAFQVTTVVGASSNILGFDPHLGRIAVCESAVGQSAFEGGTLKRGERYNWPSILGLSPAFSCQPKSSMALWPLLVRKSIRIMSFLVNLFYKKWW